MRGLAIRAEYALSRAIAEADPADEDAQLSLEIAVLQAEFLGSADWKNEQAALPIMFADEPELLRAWAEGQYRAAMAALEVRQGL
ncbi:hypothetical protein AWV79_35515 [Cupriavidus sp. UYMMa02A]|nr:hypothetical protein AWV79_35515 [Cupriavidus sp. UYMMa02A]